MREALRLLAERPGERLGRIVQNAERLWAGFEAAGRSSHVPGAPAPATLTTVRIPEGIDGKGFSLHALNRHGIEVGGGLGTLAGQVWRNRPVGLQQPRRETCESLLNLLEERSARFSLSGERSSGLLARRRLPVTKPSSSVAAFSAEAARPACHGVVALGVCRQVEAAAEPPVWGRRGKQHGFHAGLDQGAGAQSGRLQGGGGSPSRVQPLSASRPRSRAAWRGHPVRRAERVPGVFLAFVGFPSLQQRLLPSSTLRHRDLAPFTRPARQPQQVASIQSCRIPVRIEWRVSTVPEHAGATGPVQAGISPEWPLSLRATAFWRPPARMKSQSALPWL